MRVLRRLVSWYFFMVSIAFAAAYLYSRVYKHAANVSLTSLWGLLPATVFEFFAIVVTILFFISGWVAFRGSNLLHPRGVGWPISACILGIILSTGIPLVFFFARHLAALRNTWWLLLLEATFSIMGLIAFSRRAAHP